MYCCKVQKNRRTQTHKKKDAAKGQERTRNNITIIFSNLFSNNKQRQQNISKMKLNKRKHRKNNQKPRKISFPNSKNLCLCLRLRFRTQNIFSKKTEQTKENKTKSKKGRITSKKVETNTMTNKHIKQITKRSFDFLFLFQTYQIDSIQKTLQNTAYTRYYSVHFISFCFRLSGILVSYFHFDNKKKHTYTQSKINKQMTKKKQKKKMI